MCSCDFDLLMGYFMQAYDPEILTIVVNKYHYDAEN